MAVVKTSLRVTREAAKRLRFYPRSPINATNVQDAILESTNVVPIITPTNVSVANSPFAPAATDLMLLVDTSGGPVTIQMPLSGTRTFDLEVKDVTGHAAANPISILAAGAETIDDLVSYPVDSNFGAVKLGPKTGGYFAHA